MEKGSLYPLQQNLLNKHSPQDLLADPRLISILSTGYGDVVPVHDIKTYRGSRGMAPLIRNSALDGGEWSTSRTGRFNPGKERRYTLNRRLGTDQSRSGRFFFWIKEKICCPCRDSDPRSSNIQNFRGKKLMSQIFGNYIKISVVQIYEIQIILFESLRSLRKSELFPSFHETQVSLQCSHKTATGPYPEHSSLWKSKSNTEQYLYVCASDNYIEFQVRADLALPILRDICYPGIVTLLVTSSHRNAVAYFQSS